MRRTVPSWATFVYKYVFPTAWFVVFGLGVLGFLPITVKTRSGAAGAQPEQWQLVAIWIVSTIFIIWFSGRLKKVQVDDTALYISNYFSEVRVPLIEVAEITQSFASKPKTVTIHFRSETAAGMRAQFLPRFRFYFGRSHPLVAELTAVCDKAAVPGY